MFVRSGVALEKQVDVIFFKGKSVNSSCMVTMIMMVCMMFDRGDGDDGLHSERHRGVSDGAQVRQLNCNISTTRPTVLRCESLLQLL